jgi:hypothetical protein
MNITPSLLLSKSTMNSRYQSSEIEQIISNICYVAKVMGDDWRPFSADDYTNHCLHKVSEAEIRTLEYLAGEIKNISFNRGSGSVSWARPCLEKKDGMYHFILPDFMLWFS